MAQWVKIDGELNFPINLEHVVTIEKAGWAI